MIQKDIEESIGNMIPPPVVDITLEILHIYRIGTIEVENAIVSHPAVAEAGVCGVPDEARARGEIIIKAKVII